MNCLICGSNNISSTDTIVSDFVMARIAPNGKKKTIKQNCAFARSVHLRSMNIGSILKKSRPFIEITGIRNIKKLGKNLSAGILKKSTTS